MKAPSSQLLHALREASCGFRSIESSCGAHYRPPIQLRNATALAARSRMSRGHRLSTGHRFLRAAPKSKDRGPPSKEKTTTDFGALNVLGNVPPPTSSIDACLPDGFLLDSGLNIRNGSGCLLIGGEVFDWRPWELGRSEQTAMVNHKGQWHVDRQAWAVFDLVWPKPGTWKESFQPLRRSPGPSLVDSSWLNRGVDILVLGLGASMRPISPEDREYLNSLGIRIEVQDTRNAASQFNLLATERGTSQVAAALIPVGMKQ